MRIPGRLLLKIVLATLFLLPLPALQGCGDDGTRPDKSLAPLVGTWRANVLLLTSSANPEVSLDLIEEGGNFTLAILSTGQYSASLSAFGQTNTELGTVTVSGNQVTIDPTSPDGPPLVADFVFQGQTLILDGSSEYDFNLDGIPETAQAHIELDPLGG